MSIIPLCILGTHVQPRSYLAYPTKQVSDDEVKLECVNEGGLLVYGQFYAISPDFRPIPPGTVLICVKSSGTSTKISTSIKTVYDPFDIDETCVRFCAWEQPVPYTTPLFIYKQSGALYFTFERKEINAIKVIYVLTDPRGNYNRVGVNDDTSDFDIVDDKPVFRFAPQNGWCLPDPHGLPLNQCIVNRIFTQYHQPTLLRELSSSKSKSKKISLWIVLVVVIIFLLLLAWYILRRL